MVIININKLWGLTSNSNILMTQHTFSIYYEPVYMPGALLYHLIQHIYEILLCCRFIRGKLRLGEEGSMFKATQCVSNETSQGTKICLIPELQLLMLTIYRKQMGMVVTQALRILIKLVLGTVVLIRI